MTAAQAPLGSGFGVTSTASEVIVGIDLTGTRAVVTGGASGIGVDTVRALQGAGASVIVPARDVERAAAALTGIDDVEILPMDLMDPASIDAIATHVEGTGEPLHLVVASAGIGGAELERDARGYESHFATNHLGHFQLVAGLWPALQRAAGARVVLVSSWAHRVSDVIFDDLHFERRAYFPQSGYGQSKTANVLHAVALDARGQADGIRAFAVHPGTIVGTAFSRNMPTEILEAIGMIDAEGQPVLDPEKGWKSVEQGAATSVWCATSPRLDGLGALYAEDCDLARLLDHTDPEVVEAAAAFGPAALGVMDYALDPESAEHLWAVSEDLTRTTR